MSTLARLLGAIAITIGIAFLTYGAAKLGTGSAVDAHAPEPEALVALGVGLLVGGLLAIVLFGARRADSSPR
jgi:uncharacterized membrane protein YidH (DUF202 family)